MKPTSVLIADDHKILRQGLRAILEQREDIEVIAEAGNGREAVELCKRLNPDVVVLDVAMPEMSGILATGAILKDNRNTKVLILSTYLNETYIAETLKMGASGYVLKECAADELLGAIKLVNRGEIYLSPRASTMVVRKFIRREGAREKTVFDILSPREQQILQYIAEGKSTNKMAEILFLSPRTVDNHRASIMRKLDLHDIPSLVKFAVRSGISEL
ncbi:MAG: response regulator transcription factor [Actinobacteria bacterium]|nr:response regulator transcription factor [Actinomycetota bacterium]